MILLEPGGMDTPMSRGVSASVEEELTRLSPPQRELYGDLYAGFAMMMKNGGELITPLDDAAGQVVAALNADDPKPRYPIGRDTAMLLEKRAHSSDREPDGFARSIFGLEPVPIS